MIQDEMAKANPKLANILTWNWTAAHRSQEPVIRKLLQPYKDIDHIVEIGTFEGVSTALWARIANKVTTIDILDNRKKNDVWKTLQVKHKITSHIFNTQKARDTAITEACKTADLAFIDGCHIYGSILWDFNAVTAGFPRDESTLKYIVFHDYNWEKTRPIEHSWPDVTTYVDDLIDNLEMVLPGWKVILEPPFALFVKQ
jgi:hypothetical protein